MPARRPDAVFEALADENRRELVQLLARRDSATATELAPHLAVSRQAVVKHLAVLAEARLVEAARSGREVRFALTPEPLADAARWLDAIGREWDGRLDALGRHLQARGGRPSARRGRAQPR